MNSRAKGCRGERALRDEFREAGFLKARRTAQYSGASGEACDVTIPEIPSLHSEVKWVEKSGPIYDWVGQATRDSSRSGKTPVVFHKKSHQPWLAIMLLSDWLTMIKETDRVQCST